MDAAGVASPGATRVFRGLEAPELSAATDGSGDCARRTTTPLAGGTAVDWQATPGTAVESLGSREEQDGLRCAEWLRSVTPPASSPLRLPLSPMQAPSERSQYTSSTASEAKAVLRRGLSFFDAEDFKARVGRLITKSQYDVSLLYHETGWFRTLATNSAFENITLMVIAVNALWIAIDTDNNDATVLLEAEPIFIFADNFFCMYFSFEWFVRFMAFRRKRDGFKDAWFVFDSLLVAMMVGETWVMTVVMMLMGGEGGSALGNASVLRLLRLLRLSRLVRMLRSMPELMILIKGMASASRSLCITLVLLLLLIYIFAIIFRQLTDGSITGALYFNSIPGSMYSLLLHGTFLDNLGPVCNTIGNPETGSPIYLILFFLFLSMAALMVMNMLIGVLCEVVSAVAATEKEQMELCHVREKMQQIIAAIDKDEDMRISKVEFQAILENVDAMTVLGEVGVQPSALVDFATYIFDDGDSNEITLSFEDFMELVLQLRDCKVATVKDMVNLQKIVRDEMKKLEDRYKGLRKRRSSHTLESFNFLPAKNDEEVPSFACSTGLSEELLNDGQDVYLEPQAIKERRPRPSASPQRGSNTMEGLRLPGMPALAFVDFFLPPPGTVEVAVEEPEEDAAATLQATAALLHPPPPPPLASQPQPLQLPNGVAECEAAAEEPGAEAAQLRARSSSGVAPSEIEAQLSRTVAATPEALTPTPDGSAAAQLETCRAPPSPAVMRSTVALEALLGCLRRELQTLHGEALCFSEHAEDWHSWAAGFSSELDEGFSWLCRHNEEMESFGDDDACSSATMLT
eukprot:TRINITY_DN14262_c0_g4_i1.p1 TRINITY_DN14262_c0_g4~~TRINITY_DN14262_c0_g4_i1.p1  ORF type:complete len:813 (-),score=191.96 TRINITY_DN14262_c0_g4_i1:85-2490(-)